MNEGGVSGCDSGVLLNKANTKEMEAAVRPGVPLPVGAVTPGVKSEGGVPTDVSEDKPAQSAVPFESLPLESLPLEEPDDTPVPRPSVTAAPGLHSTLPAPTPSPTGKEKIKHSCKQCVKCHMIAAGDKLKCCKGCNGTEFKPQSDSTPTKKRGRGDPVEVSSYSTTAYPSVDRRKASKGRARRYSDLPNDRTSNRRVVASVEERKKMTFWTDVVAPYFKDVDDVGVFAKNYREAKYQIDKAQAAKVAERELEQLRKRHAQSRARRKPGKSAPKTMMTELTEAINHFDRCELERNLANKRPGGVDKLKPDTAMDILDARGEYFRKAWKKEDQAIEDALNPGAARRRARYEEQQRRRNEEEAKTRPRSEPTPGDSRELKPGQLVEVEAGKDRTDGTARVVSKNKNGTYDIKYIIGSLLRNVKRKHLRHEGEQTPFTEDCSDDEVNTWNGLGEGEEATRGCVLKVAMCVEGSDPVPDRPGLKNLDGSENTEFVLRCWTDDETVPVVKNAAGKATIVDMVTGKSKLASGKDEIEDATAWVPIMHTGTVVGLDMSKDTCGAHATAVKNVLAGHSLFFGAAGNRLQANKKLRDFGESSKDTQPPTLRVTGYDLVHAMPADEVDEIDAEMTYLQWKLGITQRLNEGMAAKFQKRIELEMRKEKSRNLLLKKLGDAKSAYETKLNAEREYARRQKQLAEERERKNLLVVDEHERARKRFRSHKNNESARLYSIELGQDKKELKARLSGTVSNNPVETMLASMVNYIAMCHTERFYDASVAAKALKAKERKKKAADAAVEALKAKRAEERRAKAAALKARRDKAAAAAAALKAKKAKAAAEAERKRREAERKLLEKQRKKQKKIDDKEFLELTRRMGEEFDYAYRRWASKYSTPVDVSKDSRAKDCCVMVHRLLGKSETYEGEKRYCLCRTVYDDEQFYMGCDVCDDWFHARCVGIPATIATHIKQFVCPLCQLISHRFPSKSDHFRTTFHPTVNCVVATSSDVAAVRRAGLETAAGLIHKIETSRLKRQMNNVRKAQREQKGRGLKIRLRNVMGGEYVHMNPKGSKVMVIPYRRYADEVNRAVPLMPLRVPLLNFKAMASLHDQSMESIMKDFHEKLIAAERKAAENKKKKAAEKNSAQKRKAVAIAQGGGSTKKIRLENAPSASLASVTAGALDTTGESVTPANGGASTVMLEKAVDNVKKGNIKTANVEEIQVAVLPKSNPSPKDTIVLQPKNDSPIIDGPAQFLPLAPKHALPFYLRHEASRVAEFHNAFGRVIVSQKNTFVDMDVMEGEEDKVGNTENNEKEDSEESSDDSSGEDETSDDSSVDGEEENKEEKKNPDETKDAKTTTVEGKEGDDKLNNSTLPSPKPPLQIVEGSIVDWTLADGSHPKVYVNIYNIPSHKKRCQWHIDYSEYTAAEEAKKQAKLEFERALEREVDLCMGETASDISDKDIGAINEHLDDLSEDADAEDRELSLHSISSLKAISVDCKSFGDSQSAD